MLWEGSTVCIGIQCTDAKWTILIKTLRGNYRAARVCVCVDIRMFVRGRLKARDKGDMCEIEREKERQRNIYFIWMKYHC